jgi:hypothetical protein
VTSDDGGLRTELLALASEDQRVREELIADGSLFDGYHPRMEAVHRQNAARLRELMAGGGWPGADRAGEDGAEAAWLIAQHAIGEPDFMRACLRQLGEAVAAGRAPGWQAAMLEDRIRMFEGRPQRYGTQLETGPDGRPQPYWLENPDSVETRRREAGLEPLADRLARAPREPMTQPHNPEHSDREFQAWLRRVGWRR